MFRFMIIMSFVLSFGAFIGGLIAKETFDQVVANTFRVLVNCLLLTLATWLHMENN